MRGAGLSLERWKIAEAECVPVHEGSTFAIAMRDGVAPPGSKAGSRMESIRRNMRGPTGSARLVSGGGGRRGSAGAALRAEVGSSDWFIVLMTPSKETRRAEGRDQLGRNPREWNEVRTQSRVTLPATLARVNAAARTAVQTRFTALLHHVDNAALDRAFHRQKRQASAGIDGMTVAMYEQDLERNLQDLCARIHTGRYRPQPVRRVFIPKAMAGSDRLACRRWKTRLSKARSPRC